MIFNENHPIYLQIGEWVYDKIVRWEWQENARIMSVRELGILLQVNPNTVMRTYEKLQNDAVIYNRRGIGYFVSPNAREKILTQLREEFKHEELPRIFEKMELLGLSIDTIKNCYNDFKPTENENKQ